MNKTLNTLGICKSSGNLSYGEALIKDLQKGKVYVVLIASDASLNSKKRIEDKCVFYKCKYYISFTKESISRSIGREDVVSAVGIKDSNLAKKFKENIEKDGDQNEEKQ